MRRRPAHTDPPSQRRRRQPTSRAGGAAPALLLALLVLSGSALGAPGSDPMAPVPSEQPAWHHYQTDFPPEEFRARWDRVFDRIGDSAVAVLAGIHPADGFVVPRQTNAFYYLSGIETPGAYLLLDGRDRRVTLYLPPRNERLERSEGRVLSADDAELVVHLTGVDEVRSAAAMTPEWPGSLGADVTIYTPFAPAEGRARSRYELRVAADAVASDPWDGRLSREMRLVGLLRQRHSRNQVADLTPILDELRSVKSEREIALIRRASELAGLGMIEAIRSTEPGVWEYQLDAAARYVFQVNGARLEGYRSITASGTDNIWNGHYWRNSRQMEAGDLVLMDYAPDYHYYVSDIGRVWPVDGTYRDWQRELLQFVLEYHEAVLARIRPGVTAQQILDEVAEAMDPVLERTEFSKPAYEEAARRLVATGGGAMSHPVGMAVHDDGRYKDGPLKPGHVFSVDPQIRVPEERIYLRYEDTVVVTEEGVENFTEFLPRSLDELEALARQEGIVQAWPPQESFPPSPPQTGR